MDQGEATRSQPLSIDQVCTFVEGSWQALRERGIGPHRCSILSAAAVGLVEKVWRNSPVEAAHASKRGPHDGEMMAESIHLHSVARAELNREGTYAGLLAFEDYVLGFQRDWHGTNRTIKDMLYGHLGAFQKHVKMQTNILVHLASVGDRDVMLGFLCLFTHYHGTNHYGMPRWPRSFARSHPLT